MLILKRSNLFGSLSSTSKPINKTMNRIKLFAILTAAISLGSCSSSDKENNQEVPAIEAAWRLVNVSGGIAGTNDDFSGEITWTFNADGTVNVWNTNTDVNKQDIIDTGDYTYDFVPNTVTPDSCAEAIVVNGVSYGCVSVTAETMTFSQVESDGYLLTFEKLSIVIN